MDGQVGFYEYIADSIKSKSVDEVEMITVYCVCDLTVLTIYGRKH